MMTNLKWLILAGLLLSVLRLDAQTVVGQVADEQGQPLPYANVALLTLPDSVFVAGSITDEQGHFMLKDVVPSGLVRISSVGYVTVYKETRADIGVIIMQPDAHMLQEVVVRSRLPVTRISGDALVTTVQGSVLAEAGSAGDVLARIPAVIRRDDAFEVFGKGAPLIYINGRKVRSMDELEQLNSSDIRQVEVVTNPGARYDASVKSVIRIRTVKRKGDGFGFDVRSTYSYAEKSQWHEQANLNYRHDDLDIFGSLTYRRNVRLQDSHISQETQADALWQQENTMNNESLSERVEAVTGWNYAFGREHSLGMRYSLRAMPKDRVLSGITSRVWQDGAFYDNWTSHSRNEGDHRPTHQLNVYYSGKAGRLSIDWDADYYGGKSNTRNFTHEDSQEQESRDVNSANHINNRLFATKLALSHPLGGGTLAFGGEYSRTHRRDDYLNENGLLPTSRSKIREQNVAAYAEYSRTFGFGALTAGLRYEHVSFDYYENGQRSDSQSRRYDDVFPNLSYATWLGDLQLQASYTAKIERPSYQYLSNNVSYVNRFTLQTGNPALKPTVVHDVSLNAAWKFLVGMVSYQRRTDDIIYWGEQMADNQAVTLVGNKNIGCIPMLTAYIGATPAVGCWSPNVGVGVSRQWLTLETAVGEKVMDKPMWTAEWGNTFSLPRKWRVSLDMSYQGKGYYQNVYMSRDMFTCNVSVKKSWLDDALSVELRGNDLFHSRKDGNIVQVDRLRVDQRNTINSRECVLTLRYKFNAAKNKYKGKGAGQEEIRRF